MEKRLKFGNTRSWKTILSLQLELEPLQHWMQDQATATMYDLSKWEENTSLWKEWKHLTPPPHIRPLASAFYKAIYGCALKNRRDPDTRGWVNSQYTVSKGYKIM